VGCRADLEEPFAGSLATLLARPGGAGKWIAGLTWNAPPWLALMAGTWLAIAANWRRPGG
jgi:hypothetical protein